MNLFLVRSVGKFEGWTKAAHLLFEEKSCSIVLEISHPTHDEFLTPSKINTYIRSEEQPNIFDMADTIFPQKLYEGHDLAETTHIYKSITYPKLKSDPPPNMSVRWGTYAYRLFGRETSINPFLDLVNKMKHEVQNPHPKQNCYELGLLTEKDISLNYVEDGKFRRGGPCLVHLSFKVFQDHVYLTAFYRNHDYSVTLPCNLLGLTNLLQCVATEVGLEPGSLVIHSTHAFLKKSQQRLHNFFSVIGVYKQFPNLGV